MRRPTRTRRLASTVCHDLRAAIRVLTGFSNLPCGAFRPLLNQLRMISTAGWLMIELIDELMRLPRVTDPGLTRETVRLDLRTGETVRELRHQNAVPPHSGHIRAGTEVHADVTFYFTLGSPNS
jgi:hypothetical protein